MDCPELALVVSTVPPFASEAPSLPATVWLPRTSAGIGGRRDPHGLERKEADDDGEAEP
jgi:hypothetical protein